MDLEALGRTQSLVLEKTPGLTCTPCQLRPESRGSIHAKSADARVYPSIVPNYLSDPIDQQCAVDQLKLARKIMSQKAIVEYLADPSDHFGDSDEAMLGYAKVAGGTLYHAVGTCRMGSDPAAVVDAELRVNGVEGLRVVDASIMPRISSGNTNAPTIMIAEKASDLILGKPRSAPGRLSGAGTMTNVRDAAFALFRDFGMTTIFGNPGSTELPMFRDFPDDFRYVLALQESIAVAMADGFAQATRNAALVNLHSAVGVGHALGNLFTAYRNRTPLVVVAGQQARSILPYFPFLYAEQATEFPKPYVKYSVEPARAEDVPAAIARAYHIAMQPPRGPVFVSVPVDDWDRPCDTFPARRVSRTVRGDLGLLAELAARARHGAAPGHRRRRRGRPRRRLGRDRRVRRAPPRAGLGEPDVEPQRLSRGPSPVRRLPHRRPRSRSSRPLPATIWSSRSAPRSSPTMSKASVRICPKARPCGRSSTIPLWPPRRRSARRSSATSRTRLRRCSRPMRPSERSRPPGHARPRRRRNR